MRFVVVGPGAVGGYFGGRLAEAGNSVGFLARGATLGALRERGLRIESPLGDLRLDEVEAADDPRTLAPADVVLVAVRAWQVETVAESLRPLVGKATAVVPLQNGVEAPEQLIRALGPDAVAGGLCWIISETDGPGVIRHLGAEPAITFGTLEGRDDQRLHQAREVLEAAGIRGSVADDIRAAMWEKFLFISSVSGLGAVTRAPLGVVRQQPETRELLQEAMEEICAVGRAHGVALSDDVVDRTMDFVDSLPVAATASMQRDIIEGRPSELESQSGAVVRLAAEVGLEVPVHRLLYRVLLPAERAARALRPG